MEELLLQTFGRQETLRKGPSNVYAYTSETETVVLVLDPSPGCTHKYIQALDQLQKSYFVAAPMLWIKNHSELLKCVKSFCAAQVDCKGGGFLVFCDEIYIDGASMDFGAGDHASAKRVFTRALAHPNRLI